jgi:hypothetical protein
LMNPSFLAIPEDLLQTSKEPFRSDVLLLDQVSQYL